ncbi:MAG: MoaD/ThiS family protein [Ilumatobacteraceae bacterium]
MVRLRLFAQAREAAGTGSDTFGVAELGVLAGGDGATVGSVIAAAQARYGPAFTAVLPMCKLWLNGDAAEASSPVHDGDEVAVLPPVSGG